jgi:N-acetylneuraminic acid mutarotase
MAGIMAGTHGGALIAAGGANFPDRMPWEGGRKVYYDSIFVLRPGDAAWRLVGKLPEPRAYAAVVSLPEGVLVMGGENSHAVLQDAFFLRWNGEAIAIEKAPSLPAPTTSAAAVALDGRVYLAGGFAAGAGRVSRGDFLCLDVGQPGSAWTSLPTWPGPTRGMAVVAASGGAIYLMSGLQVAAGGDGQAQSTYLRDSFRYGVDGQWERLPDLPWSAIGAPSPAPVTPQPAQIFVLGGVDGRQVGKLPRDTRVPEDILVFDVANRTWRLWPERWPESVVTVPAFARDGRWFFVSGEVMAGVRTTGVWSWRIPEKQ